MAWYNLFSHQLLSCLTDLECDRKWCTSLHTYSLNMAILESMLQRYIFGTKFGTMIRYHGWIMHVKYNLALCQREIFMTNFSMSSHFSQRCHFNSYLVESSKYHGCLLHIKYKLVGSVPKWVLMQTTHAMWTALTLLHCLPLQASALFRFVNKQ